MLGHIGIDTELQDKCPGPRSELKIDAGSLDGKSSEENPFEVPIGGSIGIWTLISNYYPATANATNVTFLFGLPSGLTAQGMTPDSDSGHTCNPTSTANIYSCPHIAVDGAFQPTFHLYNAGLSTEGVHSALLSVSDDNGDKDVSNNVDEVFFKSLGPDYQPYVRVAQEDNGQSDNYPEQAPLAVHTDDEFILIVEKSNTGRGSEDYQLTIDLPAGITYKDHDGGDCAATSIPLQFDCAAIEGDPNSENQPQLEYFILEESGLTYGNPMPISVTLSSPNDSNIENNASTSYVTIPASDPFIESLQYKTPTMTYYLNSTPIFGELLPEPDYYAITKSAHAEIRVSVGNDLFVATAENVKITFTSLPEGMVLGNHTPDSDCTTAGNNEFNCGNIAQNGSKDAKISVDVSNMDCSDNFASESPLTLTVTSTSVDGNETNNDRSATVVIECVDIAAEQYVFGGGVNYDPANDTFTWNQHSDGESQFVSRVTNLSNMPAEDIQIKIANFPNWIYVNANNNLFTPANALEISDECQYASNTGGQYIYTCETLEPGNFYQVQYNLITTSQHPNIPLQCTATYTLETTVETSSYDSEPGNNSMSLDGQNVCI